MGQNKVDVSIIIVTYNVLDLLKDCLKSIHSKLNVEIFIIDNGNDQTANFFKTTSSKYTYIKNEENIGFARANNIGLKIAKGKYFLVLNPDTKLNKNTIDIMFEYMEKNSK